MRDAELGGPRRSSPTSYGDPQFTARRMSRASRPTAPRPRSPHGLGADSRGSVSGAADRTIPRAARARPRGRPSVCDWERFPFDAAKADTSVPRVARPWEYNPRLGRAYTRIAGEAAAAQEPVSRPERRARSRSVRAASRRAPYGSVRGHRLQWTRVRGVRRQTATGRADGSSGPRRPNA